MILFLSISGIFLSVILLYFNAKSYRSSVYLGLYFLFVSIYGLYQHTLTISGNRFFIQILLFLIPVLGTTFYLIGPLLYWYIRSVITDDHRLIRTDLWHFLPSVVFFLSSFHALIVPPDHLVEAANDIALKAEAMGNYRPSLLSPLISYPAFFLSRPLILLGYTIAAILHLTRYLRSHDKDAVFSGQQFMSKWMVILLISSFLLVSSYILLMFDFTLYKINFELILLTFQIISVSALTGLLISPILFPSVLYGLPRFPATTIQAKSQLPDSVQSGVIATNENTLLSEEEFVQSSMESKTSNTSFESDYLHLIEQRTEEYMLTYQPYLQQDFNMAQLSVMLKVPQHHLAYYFREVKQMSFTDFRNSWRVDHAKQLILEGKSNNLTLEAIGILSGFSSRNTFLNAFKKAEGLTPNDFKSRAQEA